MAQIVRVATHGLPPGGARAALRGAVAGGLVAAAWSLITPTYYQSGATILPEVRGARSDLAGAAELLGQLGSGLLSSSTSPQFYAELFRSQSVLTEVVKKRFATGGSQPPTPLESLLVIGKMPPDKRSERAVARLRDLSQAGYDTRTGLVSFSVFESTPRLAKEVADSTVAAVSRFDVERRQTRARAERAFVEQRASAMREELRQAEDSLRRFYTQNRTYQQSPELRFIEARLQRDVTIRQEIYVALARQLEEARVQEVRDLPVFTVVDTATVPTQRALPKRKLMTVLGLVLGALAGLAMSYLLAVGRRVAPAPEV